MKRILSLLLVFVIVFSLSACGNKAEEEAISNQISDMMSKYQLTDYTVSIKNSAIVCPEFKDLQKTEQLAIVKYLYFEDVSIRVISDGVSRYYYEPYNMSEKAPTPGLYKKNDNGDKLILADGNPFGN